MFVARQLSHDCDDGDFGGLSSFAERGVFNLEVGVETHGNQGWHVEGIAQGFAPAERLAFPLAGLTAVGDKAGQASGLLSVQCADFR